MPEESEKELIKTLIFDDSIRSNVNSFSSRKHLFDFGIDSDLSLNENKAVPELKQRFHQDNDDLHIDLEYGFTEALEKERLIKNFDNNRKQTWIEFLRCLESHKTVAEEEPTFVTLTPLLCDLFTVEEYESTFFALKFKGVIYLFRNQSVDIEAEEEEEVRPHAFYFVRFLYLICNRNETDINAFEKNLRVDRIQLADNKLIVCHGIAANDVNGSPVYVKCRQIYQRFIEQELKQRLLFDWSHCMISGVPTVIRGRRHRSTLQEVDVMDVQTIPEKCSDYWSPSKCFSFVDQSLEFIKSCIDSELVLYEFVVKPEDKTLSCFRHDTNDTSYHFLPQFYVNSGLNTKEETLEEQINDPRLKVTNYKRSETKAFEESNQRTKERSPEIINLLRFRARIK